ncbi:hypothetical protein GGTG_03097 [Gaeumannomyces tritici R3-111a-1]|uniref:Uncharacterized protein n=1 Tax=Gaeumannomyces tritici (strain R3-111a-1) TaxID=644352 RepID=J3NP91_GAET3|nr:hypothetical protein GGTG_03097 [Gaeumannomyces tritici R3-111a-1]EJT77994.1 hypothetical protein GGTG_03097 [Gaeumannomyces tritici R3-111a-1]
MRNAPCWSRSDSYSAAHTLLCRFAQGRGKADRRLLVGHRSFSPPNSIPMDGASRARRAFPPRGGSKARTAAAKAEINVAQLALKRSASSILGPLG